MTIANDEKSVVDSISSSTGTSRVFNRSFIAVVGFFVVKAAVGLLILTASAKQLPVAEFATFSQLFLFLSLLGSVAGAGVQNGVIREMAAAHGDHHKQRMVIFASLLLWACFAVTVIIPLLLFREAIGIILIGTGGVAQALALLVIVSLAAGAGTLLCSALSGAGNAPFSMFIQGVGLVVGGALALCRLDAGDAVGAVMGYALGTIFTAAFAIWAARRWLNPRGLKLLEICGQAKDLLGYASTFLVVVSALPLVLFGVRYVYRLEFGAEWLSLWLVANRVSDVSTQVLGLYLSQVFLPEMTRAAASGVRLRVITRTLMLGAAISATGAFIFSIGSAPIIHFALSDHYQGALPFILGYLVGDVFRIGGNVALYSALAARKLALFAIIEVTLAILVGCAILFGIFLKYPSAAYWGYVSAHVISFCVVILLARRISKF